MARWPVSGEDVDRFVVITILSDTTPAIELSQPFLVLVARLGCSLQIDLMLPGRGCRQ